MKELTEVAAKYAAEKTNEVMINAIAKAYADGYRDGYKDREEEIPIDLRSKETEYVDLGLPSGTLWAKDYEKDADGKILYLPYQKAKHMQLPTEELCKELFETCEWLGDYSSTSVTLYGVTCIGPNGNSIKFSSAGYTVCGKPSSYRGGEILFWVNDDEKDDKEKNAVYMDRGAKWIPKKEIKRVFSGFSLPIRLVRTKQSEANV